jgi:phospholipase/carboxylesterase/glyoxalase family protein
MMSNEHPIQGFMHRFIPSSALESAPTLLLLHGTGGNEHDLLDVGRLLMPSASLLSPRGKVLENEMPRFFRRFAEGVLDIEDLHARTHELADFVLAASQEYHFDPARVIALGFSNGANIAASMLLLRPEVLAGAMLFHPMDLFEPDPLPDLSRTVVFIGAGRRDPLVPVAQTERLAALLQRSGTLLTVNWHNGSHALSHEDVRGARDWLRQLPQSGVGEEHGRG